MHVQGVFSLVLWKKHPVYVDNCVQVQARHEEEPWAATAWLTGPTTVPHTANVSIQPLPTDHLDWAEPYLYLMVDKQDICQGVVLTTDCLPMSICNVNIKIVKIYCKEPRTSSYFRLFFSSCSRSVIPGRPAKESESDAHCRKLGTFPPIGPTNPHLTITFCHNHNCSSKGGRISTKNGKQKNVVRDGCRRVSYKWIGWDGNQLLAPEP